MPPPIVVAQGVTDRFDSSIQRTLNALVDLMGDSGSSDRPTHIMHGNWSGLQTVPALNYDADLVGFWSNAAGVIISLNGRTTLGTNVWNNVDTGVIGITVSAQATYRVRVRVPAQQHIYVYFPSQVDVILVWERVAST